MAEQKIGHCHRNPLRVLVCCACVFVLWSAFSLSCLWHPVTFQMPTYQTANNIFTNTTSHSPLRPEYGERGATAFRANSSSKSSEDLFFDTDESYLLPQLHRLGLHVRRNMGKRHQTVRTEFERSLMRTSPLRDFRQAPDELKSKVYLLSRKPQYRVGDVVRFRVDLYDGYGHPRQSGGDEIRMRLTSKPGNASIAAEVMDLRNGSYLGTTSLQWHGTASVQVYLTYPREFLREAVRVRLTIHATKWIGYARVCNFTDYNGGLSYFCGRPTAKRLDCRHRKYFQILPAMSNFPLSISNRELHKKMDRKPCLRLIPNTISIHILRGREDLQNLLPPCWKMTSNSTWHSHAPSGWMDKEGVWRSLTCSLPVKVHAQHVQNCLRDTSIFLVGDSNMRHWWYELRHYLNCSLEEGGNIHQHRLCEVWSYHTTLKWAFHGRPTCTKTDSDNVPLPLAMADIRHHLRHLHRRVILIVHYFLHFSFYSLAEFVDRVRAAKKYIEEFLREFPRATVIIRGPHVVLYSSEGNHLVDGDTFGPAYIRIWKEEFRDLWDRVRFLDYWDMTIATQNGPSHPPLSIRREMVKVLLGYICRELW